MCKQCPYGCKTGMSGKDKLLGANELDFHYDTPQVNVILFMSFAFGGVFACFFSHFHQLMITDSGLCHRNIDLTRRYHNKAFRITLVSKLPLCLDSPFGQFTFPCSTRPPYFLFKWETPLFPLMNQYLAIRFIFVIISNPFIQFVNRIYAMMIRFFARITIKPAVYIRICISFQYVPAMSFAFMGIHHPQVNSMLITHCQQNLIRLLSHFQIIENII